MKRFHILISRAVAVTTAVAAAVTLAGCADNGDGDLAGDPEIPVIEQQRIHAAWRVDMIIGDNPHQLMLAEYTYDAEGRLTQANLSEQNKPESMKPGIGSQFEEKFVWEDGRVTRQHTHMIYQVHSPDQTYEQTFETVYRYDPQGNMLHWNDINQPGDRKYEYDDQGRLIQTYCFEFEGLIYRDRLEWDDRGNVVRHICNGPESNMIEQPIPGSLREQVYEYEYDNNPKPNFGLGNSFFWDGRYSPWPFAENSDEQLARTLSANNLTRCEQSGLGYRYTYNEHGLPATVEAFWIGDTRLNWYAGMNTVQTIVYEPLSIN